MSSAAKTTDLQDKPPQNQNNPFVFLLNIPQCLINSLMNFINDRKKQEKKVQNDVQIAEEKALNDAKTPDSVSFPLVKYDAPTIKLESDDVVKEDTNPIILWQVYALGGFILAKWAWGKWQERKANAKDDDDENDPPAGA